MYWEALLLCAPDSKAESKWKHFLLHFNHHKSILNHHSNELNKEASSSRRRQHITIRLRSLPMCAFYTMFMYFFISFFRLFLFVSFIQQVAYWRRTHAPLICLHPTGKWTEYKNWDISAGLGFGLTSMECRLEIHHVDRWWAINAARDHLLSGHFRDSETDCGTLGMQIKRRNAKNPMFLCSTIKLIQLSQLNAFECRIEKWFKTVHELSLWRCFCYKFNLYLKLN